ncbi:MAG: helix-turn-helix transcriptional regulator [Eubacteriales bacterium]|nr:helix-turn-helix transcriptional regulator [Eubacteriales bacterium]MDD4390652.1 helix-turn-helix transcriptional regulator [Eubacteriales bacterium]
MTVAEKIKKIINEEGYKQYVIARKAGMSAKQFNALLNGRKTFTVDYLPQICRAIDKTPSEIFGFSEEKQ